MQASLRWCPTVWEHDDAVVACCVEGALLRRARSAGRGRAGMIPTLNASLRWCRPSMQISLFIL